MSEVGSPQLSGAVPPKRSVGKRIAETIVGFPTLIGDSMAEMLSINQSTLSGAIDIIVVPQKDGSLKSSPFQIRFGKFQVMKAHEKIVTIVVNEEPVDVTMRLGYSGEAYFIDESSYLDHCADEPDSLAGSIDASPRVSRTSPVPPRLPADSRGLQAEEVQLDARAVGQGKELLPSSLPPPLSPLGRRPESVEPSRAGGPPRLPEAALQGMVRATASDPGSSTAAEELAVQGSASKPRSLFRMLFPASSGGTTTPHVDAEGDHPPPAGLKQDVARDLLTPGEGGAVPVCGSTLEGKHATPPADAPVLPSGIAGGTAGVCCADVGAAACGAGAGSPAGGSSVGDGSDGGAEDVLGAEVKGFPAVWGGAGGGVGLGAGGAYGCAYGCGVGRSAAGGQSGSFVSLASMNKSVSQASSTHWADAEEAAEQAAEPVAELPAWLSALQASERAGGRAEGRGAAAHGDDGRRVADEAAYEAEAEGAEEAEDGCTLWAEAEEVEPADAAVVAEQDHAAQRRREARQSHPEPQGLELVGSEPRGRPIWPAGAGAGGTRRLGGSPPSLGVVGGPVDDEADAEARALGLCDEAEPLFPQDGGAGARRTGQDGGMGEPPLPVRSPTSPVPLHALNRSCGLNVSPQEAPAHAQAPPPPHAGAPLPAVAAPVGLPQKRSGGSLWPQPGVASPSGEAAAGGGWGATGADPRPLVLPVSLGEALRSAGDARPVARAGGAGPPGLIRLRVRASMTGSVYTRVLAGVPPLHALHDIRPAGAPVTAVPTPVVVEADGQAAGDGGGGSGVVAVAAEEGAPAPAGDSSAQAMDSSDHLDGSDESRVPAASPPAADSPLPVVGSPVPHPPPDGSATPEPGSLGDSEATPALGPSEGAAAADALSPSILGRSVLAAAAHADGVGLGVSLSAVLDARASSAVSLASSDGPVCLSLCGGPASSSWPPLRATVEQLELFSAHRVSRDRFEAEPLLLFHPDMRVRVAGCYIFTYATAAPLLVANLAYGASLERDDLPHSSALLIRTTAPAPPIVASPADAAYRHWGRRQPGKEGRDGSHEAGRQSEGVEVSRRRSWFSWARSTSDIHKPAAAAADDACEPDLEAGPAGRGGQPGSRSGVAVAAPPLPGVGNGHGQGAVAINIEDIDDSDMPALTRAGVVPAGETSSTCASAGGRNSIITDPTPPDGRLTPTSLAGAESADGFLSSDLDAGVGGRPRRPLRKTTTPSSEQLHALHLRPGANTICFCVNSEWQGTQVLLCNIYLLSPAAKLVISDVDGTITKSDVLGQMLPRVGVDWSHLGVTALHQARTPCYPPCPFSARRPRREDASVLPPPSTRPVVVPTPTTRARACRQPSPQGPPWGVHHASATLPSPPPLFPSGAEHRGQRVPDDLSDGPWHRNGHHHQGVPEEHPAGRRQPGSARRAGAALAHAAHRVAHPRGHPAESRGV